MDYKALIVDDDTTICKLLQKVMDSNSLSSDTANSGKEALNKLKYNTYDIILLDILLGDMEGFDLLKNIRTIGIDTPVIIISGRDEDFDILYGLNIGADDYITKPFSPVLIGAKVKALIRRDQSAHARNTGVIQTSNFKFDTTTYKFYKNDKEVILSNKESKLIHLFMKNPNMIFTKEMIYEKVWGDSVIVDDNTIMVYINRLRSKVEDDVKKPKHILTVRGVGYRFVC